MSLSDVDFRLLLNINTIHNYAAPDPSILSYIRCNVREANHRKLAFRTQKKNNGANQQQMQKLCR